MLTTSYEVIFANIQDGEKSKLRGLIYKDGEHVGDVLTFVRKVRPDDYREIWKFMGVEAATTCVDFGPHLHTYEVK